MTVNIDGMPAGVELDILVAEALGYVQVTSMNIGVENTTFIVVEGVPSISDDRVYIRQGVDDFTLFAPSTDIADAWEVVEGLHGRGIYFSLTYENDGAEWHCWLNNAIGDEPASIDFEVEASSALLAICRAALKLMGGK